MADYVAGLIAVDNTTTVIRAPWLRLRR